MSVHGFCFDQGIMGNCNPTCQGFKDNICEEKFTVCGHGDTGICDLKSNLGEEDCTKCPLDDE